jgi:hypothetical protein
MFNPLTSSTNTCASVTTADTLDIFGCYSQDSLSNVAIFKEELVVNKDVSGTTANIR